ncbi:lysophospholipid acyltransferase family protein [Parasphaerochaeta coccoides]|uniref:Phospholipid/glycerol acyltransferase n=1 Tax=Parasphaerochaeta coccoides (strain ATCC BAA-1237 / DSM 17374 / SPN1) TaxID=760011 RepID=F4GIF3_PARC1|nr:lysophospholipid acyltransferase family protein [Parasphaerochaeta coccoides]AEC01661.1 phospholipid/glycerol acyltransferase [Parasphaerochaeta coccoides DSM 17374]
MELDISESLVDVVAEEEKEDIQEIELNEARYIDVMNGARGPRWWRLFRQAVREDEAGMLPKVFLHCLSLVTKMPKVLVRRKGEKRRLYTFNVIQSWCRKICHKTNLHLEIVGASNVPYGRACLYVCNHMSAMDIPALFAVSPIPFAFVANSLFSQLPFFSFWTDHSGSVYVKQGDGAEEMKAMRDMIASLKGGASLALFPEGYIFQHEGLAEFKRGGISSAVIAQVPIVPVCIWGTQDAFPPGHLYIKPDTKIRIEFGDPIETAGMKKQERKDIEEKVRIVLFGMKTRVAKESHGERVGWGESAQ